MQSHFYLHWVTLNDYSITYLQLHRFTKAIYIQIYTSSWKCMQSHFYLHWVTLNDYSITYLQLQGFTKAIYIQIYTSSWKCMQSHFYFIGSHSMTIALHTFSCRGSPKPYTYKCIRVLGNACSPTSISLGHTQ